MALEKSIPGDSFGGSSSETLNYPIDLLTQVAARILGDATAALEQHQTLWRQVQEFLRENDVDGKMEAVLRPHEQRMRDSYNWQMQLASSLFSAIDAITENEDTLAKSFQRDHGAF